MKKLILTIAIVLGIAMGSFAQNLYGFWFFRPEETKDESGLFNRNETIDDEGFGAAYALAKRNKKE